MDEVVLAPLSRTGGMMSRSFTIAAMLLLLGGTQARAQYQSHRFVIATKVDSATPRDHAAGARAGAKWGALVGVGIGIVGAVTGDACTNYGNGTGTRCERLSASESVLVIGISTAVGALVGAGIGAITGKEHDRLPDTGRAAPRISDRLLLR